MFASSQFILIATVAIIALAIGSSSQADDAGKNPLALNFTMKTLGGKDVKLSKYKDNVLLVVNVASECGLTPQYEQLQDLHEKYAKQGLVVIGFPCNQFGQQEPGASKEIAHFCKTQYGVKFDMFAKVNVNGSEACDLYKYLTSLDTKPKGAGTVKWNFEKFLIGRGGDVVARYDPRTRPDDPSIIQLIEAELAGE